MTWTSNLVPLFGLVALVALPDLAAAGAPASPTRETTLAHVCRRGSSRGAPCVEAEDCAPGERCVLDVLEGPGTRFDATVTLIVDDDVSQFDGSEDVPNVVAVTVLLEIDLGPGSGRRHLLAQTYQNLEGATLEALVASLQDGPFVFDTHRSGGGGGTGGGGGGGGGGGTGGGGQGAGNRVTEELLNFTVERGRLLDNFLFQQADAAMAGAVRDLLGIDGRPVVIQTARASRLLHVDRDADGLASLVRLPVTVRFVAD